ncbi:MAG: gamma-butyrobetaine hydroxylase-like domain-containing protein [Janthinobacterium lividum]
MNRDAPQRIGVDRAARTLTLHWSDGVSQTLRHDALRRACLCAQCRRIRLDGGEIIVPPDISIEDVVTMGYGVQLVFSDGHARGIYPWQFLADLPS